MLTSRICLSLALCGVAFASAAESTAQPAVKKAGRAALIRAVPAEPGPLPHCIDVGPPPEFVDHVVQAHPAPWIGCGTVKGFHHFHRPALVHRFDERRLPRDLHDELHGSFEPPPGGVVIYRRALGPYSLEKFRLQVEAPPPLCQSGQPIPWHVNVTVGEGSVLLQFEPDRSQAATPAR